MESGVPAPASRQRGLGDTALSGVGPAAGDKARRTPLGGVPGGATFAATVGRDVQGLGEGGGQCSTGTEMPFYGVKLRRRMVWGAAQRVRVPDASAPHTQAIKVNFVPCILPQ